jgi:hypothetical protein
VTDLGRMSVQDLVAKVLADEHAEVLRQAVVWLAEQLMRPRSARPPVGHMGSAAATGWRAATAIASGPGTPGWGRSSWPSPSCGKAATSRASWNRAADLSRRWSRSSRRPMSTGSRPARSTGWSRPWGWPGIQRQRLAAVRWPGRAGAGLRGAALEAAYPYLWLDAKVEKVRAGGRVEHRALVVAYGVDASGQREVIGLDVGAAETEAFWREFLRSLVRRGLRGVQLVVSDAHEGLKAAIAQVLSAPWQRCTVHFLRDALGHCPRTSSSWSGRPSGRSSGPARSRRPGSCWARR